MIGFTSVPDPDLELRGGGGREGKGGGQTDPEKLGGAVSQNNFLGPSAGPQFGPTIMGGVPGPPGPSPGSATALHDP